MSHAYSDSFLQGCSDQNIDAMWAAYADSCRIEELESENAKLREERDEWRRVAVSKQDIIDHMRNANAENAKLREQIERLQPTDCEGNVLDIADTVEMLRSEYDGDHEWEDVVTELVLTKWGGDRWIVRGSKGEAWACDCTKTGYDEDAYEASDDVEPFGEPTLLEVENAKLRELMSIMAYCNQFRRDCDGCSMNGAAGIITERAGCDELLDRMRELGVGVDAC